MLIEHLTRLDKSSRRAVYVGLVFIAGVAMYGWIVSPHVEYLQAVQQYGPALDKIIRKQSDIQQTLASRQHLLEKLRVQFEQAGSTLCTAEQMQQLLGQFQTMAEQVGGSLAQMDLSTEEPEVVIGKRSDPAYVELFKAGLSVIGEYDSLVSFVEGLDNLDRQIYISSLDIELLKDARLSEHECLLKCDMVIEVYVIQKEMAKND